MKPTEKRTARKQRYLGASGYDIMEVGAAFPFEGPDTQTVRTPQGPEPCHGSRIQHIQAFWAQRASDYANFTGTEEQWRAEWLPNRMKTVKL